MQNLAQSFTMRTFKDPPSDPEARSGGGGGEATINNVGWRTPQQIRNRRLQVVSTVFSVLFLALFLVIIYSQLGTIYFLVCAAVVAVIVAPVIYCQRRLAEDEDAPATAP